MRVCIVAEGCYPFVVGGVSSWVHSLIQLFPETEFVILAIAANRSQRGKYAYELPKNVSAVYELYLDDVDWSGSKKLHRKRLKKEQYQALRSLILDQDIEWDVLFDLFQKENVSLNALLELLRRLDAEEYEISLYVLLGQGEMISQVPQRVHVKNKKICTASVLSGAGRRKLIQTSFLAFFRHGRTIKKMQYVIQNFFRMKKTGNIQPDKLLWRVISDGADRFSETFDLAVAYLEGGSAYYVADHVNAKKKAAFVHIAYGNSGYTREMDRDCYEKMDQIFTVSQETRRHFLEFYPEYEKKVQVFHNILDTDRIAREAQLPGGFSDSYTGIRILTVGRLAYQKAYDIAIPAMKKIREDGYEARWYVLGEGSERNALEKQIAELGLQEDFQLPGAKENLFPYYAQCDLYVHATRFEGKSIAIQEAQTLGCAVIASDCAGNREQIVDGEDGLLCTLTPEGIAEKVEELLDDPKKRERLAAAAKQKMNGQTEEIWKLLNLMK